MFGFGSFSKYLIQDTGKIATKRQGHYCHRAYILGWEIKINKVILDIYQCHEENEAGHPSKG